LPYAIDKFKRFAKNIWDVNVTEMSDKDAAIEGLNRMEKWMKEIGVVLNSRELGVTEDMLEGIANATFILKGGYKILTHDDIIDILKESMK
jgi:alcohol dehydrogenase YqhD (iron-dependent ADH family)